MYKILTATNGEPASAEEQELIRGLLRLSNVMQMHPQATEHFLTTTMLTMVKNPERYIETLKQAIRDNHTEDITDAEGVTNIQLLHFRKTMLEWLGSDWGLECVSISL